MPLLSLKLTRSQPFRLRAGAFRQKKQHTQGLSVGQWGQRNECPQILFVPLPCNIQPFHLSNPQLYTITPSFFFLFSCHLSLPFSLDKKKNVIQWVHELVRERGEIWCVEVWKGVYWVPGGGSSPPSLHQGTSSPTSLPCDSWPPHPPSYKTLFSRYLPPFHDPSIPLSGSPTDSQPHPLLHWWLACSSTSSTPAHVLPLTGWNQLQVSWPLSSLTHPTPHRQYMFHFSSPISIIASLTLSSARTAPLWSQKLCSLSVWPHFILSLCIPVQSINYS